MQAETRALIDSLERGRDQLNAVLEKITPEAEIFPSWKRKHFLDHITGWDALVASAFQTHSLGGTPYKILHGIDRYNAQSVEERKALSDEQSRRAYDDARSAVILALQDMPDEKLNLEFHAPWGGSCTVADVVKIFVHHELEHAGQLEEIAAQAK